MLQPLIGSHPSIVRIRSRLGQLAESQKPLVVVGETGTGKSLVAAHIHTLSPYNLKPLRWINLSTLSWRNQGIELLGAEPPSSEHDLEEHP